MTQPAADTPRHIAIVSMRNAPYPVPADSVVPPSGSPFFDGMEAGRRFHTAPRGGRYFEDEHYADNRSLLIVPPSFDRAQPAALIVFFHGNGATLQRDVVVRQQVPAQLEGSRLNALLVAPQLAVEALDSSPGRFYEAGFLDAYLEEAAQHLATLGHGRFDAAYVRGLPIVLVAYSGGYLAAAYCLHQPSDSRAKIRGVVLLDALFGEEQKFARWISEAHRRAFFVNASSPASVALAAVLRSDLAGDGVDASAALPSALEPGDVVLLASPGASHIDFMTRAWTRDPLERVLSRIDLSQVSSDR